MITIAATIIQGILTAMLAFYVQRAVRQMQAIAAAAKHTDLAISDSRTALVVEIERLAAENLKFAATRREIENAYQNQKARDRSLGI